MYLPIAFPTLFNSVAIQNMIQFRKYNKIQELGENTEKQKYKVNTCAGKDKIKEY